MKKLIYMNHMRFKEYNMVKPQKKWLLERKKVRRGKRSHKKIKEENKIQNDYKRIKISNHSLFHKQNYNLLKKVLTHYNSF